MSKPQSGFPVQGLMSVPDPEHGLPDPDGAGLSHFRVLVRFPLPQVAEQAEYELHCPQLPLTLSGIDKTLFEQMEHRLRVQLNPDH